MDLGQEWMHLEWDETIVLPGTKPDEEVRIWFNGATTFVYAHIEFTVKKRWPNLEGVFIAEPVFQRYIALSTGGVIALRDYLSYYADTFDLAVSRVLDALSTREEILGSQMEKFLEICR